MARQNVRDAVAQDQAAGGAGTDVATRDDPAKAMLDEISAAVEAQLPAHIKPEYFLRAALTMMRGKSGPKLAAICREPAGRASFYAAILECARHGLMPGTDEAAIVPFGKTAAFIPQYQGLVKQMLNSGQIAAVEARLIHKADQWALAYGDQGGFYHKPALVDDNGDPVDRGPAILAYCYVTLRDGTRSTVTTVTRQEAIEVRDRFSRSYQLAEANGKRDSAWHTDFDSQWRKTAVRQHAKWVPRSPELVELLLAAARDDVERPPGAEPPTAMDLGWTVDVGGVVDGEVIEGQVVDDNQASAAPGTASQRTEAAAGTEARPESPAAAPPGPGPVSEERAHGVAPVPGQDGAGLPGPGDSDGPRSRAGEAPSRPPDERTAILAELRAAMDAAKIAGPARLALVGVLAAGDQPPLQLATISHLTLEQARVARATLAQITRMAGQDGKDLAALLAGIADGALRQQAGGTS